MTPLAQALRRLEQLWRNAGLPVDEWYRPGLPAETVHATLTAAGLPVPGDIVDWYTWRNGRAVLGCSNSLGPDGWEPWSLDDALSQRLSMLEGADDLAQGLNEEGIGPSFWWQPHWLYIAGSGSIPALAGVLDDSEVRLRMVSWDDPESMREAVDVPLLTAVTGWADLIESGQATWDDTQQAWILDPTNVPTQLRQIGLTY